MKQVLLRGIIFLSFQITLGQVPSGEEILSQIDANLNAKTLYVTSKMVIHGRRSTRTLEAQSWIEGKEKALTEYLSPPREKGTKMLKLGKMLWMYSPSADRIIQISGHMLKQSVMGSDLSYEDMLEDRPLTEDYHATLVGEDTVDNRPCWVMDLNAKHGEIPYSARKLWVDKEYMVPLMEEFYAKGGTLLKRLILKDIVKIDGRWYPKRFVYKDMLKTGQGTEFLIETIQFNVDIPPHLFTKSALRK